MAGGDRFGIEADFCEVAPGSRARVLKYRALPILLWNLFGGAIPSTMFPRLPDEVTSLHALDGTRPRQTTKSEASLI